MATLVNNLFGSADENAVSPEELRSLMEQYRQQELKKDTTFEEPDSPPSSPIDQTAGENGLDQIEEALENQTLPQTSKFKYMDPSAP